MALNYKKLGQYIQQVDVKNIDEKLGEEDLYGVSVSREFITSHANLVGVKFNNYKIVKSNQFTYIPDTSRRGDKIAIAHNKFGKDIIVSSVYTVFEVTKPDELNAEYLMLLFSNHEFDRYARYNSWGSAREVFSWEDLCDSELYIPDITEQEKIVKQYKTIINRIDLLNKINFSLYECCKLGYSNLLQGYCIEDNEFPEGWEKTTIGKYVNVKSGYAFKSNWWQKEGNKVIKIANIENETINMAECDCVSDLNSQKANDFWVKEGDLLIAMTGATTGKIGIVPQMGEKLLVNQRVGKFYLGEDPFEKLPYLFCVLHTDEVSKQIHPDGDTGSAQDNLSPDDIKNISILMPSKEEIDDFNKSYKALLKITTQNNGEIIYLNELKEKIISKLI